eukprot:SAG31_NODE_7395_length_1701_cov_1.344569_1_plen_541_part_01
MAAAAVLTSAAALAATATVASAAVRMPAFFGDNMVVQTRSRGGDRAFLSGWAAPREEVTVTDTNAGTYGQPIYRVTAGADGSWAVQMHPGTYGVTSTITVTGSGGGPPAVARNASFGDVVLCVGGDQMAATAASTLPCPLQLPSNVFVFVVGVGATSVPPPPGRRDVPEGSSAGWLRADDPRAAATIAATSALCLQTAAELTRVPTVDRAAFEGERSALAKGHPGTIGLVIAAAAGSELHEWVPASAAEAHCGAAGHLPGIGKHYNAMVAPFSMISTRAALWAMHNSSSRRSTSAISAATEACLFRAMINGMRDAQQTGDYSFIFAQSPAESSAIAMGAALPHPSSLLVNGSGGSGGFPDDHQLVDTTGVGVPDLLVDVTDRVVSLAKRMALALVGVAFAAQPRGKFAGPMLSSAAVHPAEVGGNAHTGGASTSLEMTFSSVLPGKLQLRGTPDCSVCCTANGLDIRLATSADLRANSTVSIRASHVEISGANESTLIASFPEVEWPNDDLSRAYKVAIFVGGKECVLLGTTSNLSAAAVA